MRKEEFESTGGQLEQAKAKSRKQSKVIDKLCAQIKHCKQCVDAILSTHNILPPNQHSSNSNSDLDYLKQVPDRLRLIQQFIGDTIDSFQQQIQQLSSELASAEHKHASMQQHQDQTQFLRTEVDTLKHQLGQVKEERLTASTSAERL